MKDRIRKATEKINSLYNPAENEELCRDGKKRLKVVEQTIRDEVYAERNKFKEPIETLEEEYTRHYRKPTHGSCCTCQKCGHYHDDCLCNTIEWLKGLTRGES